jgi:hypothetical protein
MAAKAKGHCAHAATHRKAQARYVSGHRAKHRAAVKRSEGKHKAKVLARKRAARKANPKGKRGGKLGRPRECS